MRGHTNVQIMRSSRDNGSGHHALLQAAPYKKPQIPDFIFPMAGVKNTNRSWSPPSQTTVGGDVRMTSLTDGSMWTVDR
ncbi:hypothetical protein STEG23_020581 [Scotinomys teguina]